MSKSLEIILTDTTFNIMPPFTIGDYDDVRPMLHKSECQNILKQFEGKELTMDDALYAIDTLIAYYARNNMYRTVIDIDERDRRLAPAKEITLEEIEKKLGYKVKIVSDKEE